MLLICTGHWPVAGCGKLLSEEEREYYGSCCEECERDWSATIGTWRSGGENPDLDAMFDDKPERQ